MVPEIRLLGVLEVHRGHRTVELPASRKARALLGYLAANDRSYGRERLCNLLWEGPNDPRGALRWSLSRLRKSLGNDPEGPLRADRTQVSLDRNRVAIDVALVNSVLTDLDHADAADIELALSAFRGEFLDGLDLMSCFRFHAWVVARREEARASRTSLFAELNARADTPDARLRTARRWITFDPLAELPRLSAMAALAELGRHREALAEYDDYCGLLAREIGSKPSSELEKARRSLGPAARRQPPPAQPVSTVSGELASPGPGAARVPDMVGRSDELERVHDLVAAASVGSPHRALLVSGEPGIGKSRLLEELAAQVTDSGGRVLHARGFEAEMVRPYGVWFDALRPVNKHDIPAEVASAIAVLLSEPEPSVESPLDRNRLFDGVVRLLEVLAFRQPVALVIEDLHWVDEMSLAILHYACRSLSAARGVLLATSVRPGELIDNRAALEVTRTLSREQRLERIELSPLTPSEIATLTRQICPTVEVQTVVTESEGNPLVAIEVARALSEASDDGLEALHDLIGQRLGRLSTQASELVGWMVCLGRTVELDRLAGAFPGTVGELAAGLEELERRGIARSLEHGAYDFSHDTLRQKAYSRLSAPHRRLMHLRIARTLWKNEGDSVAGDVAYHAARGCDHRLAVEAGAAAANHCNRMLATADAVAMVSRTLPLVDHLDLTERVAPRMALLQARILAHSSAGLAHPGGTEDELLLAIAEAENAGFAAEAATGHYLLSVVSEDAGDPARAQRDSLRAAQIGRAADHATWLRRTANTARCLIQLGRGIDRARDLVAEVVGDQAVVAGDTSVEVSWALGLLRRWDGDETAAVAHLEDALALAGQSQDRWRECSCLVWLARLELERGRPARAREHCDRLRARSQRMGEGAKGPMSAALASVADLTTGERTAQDGLERSLETLRAQDCAAEITVVQGLAAELDLRRGDLDSARRRCAEAIDRAVQAKRVSEHAFASALMAMVEGRSDDARAGAARLGSLTQTLGSLDGVDGRARRAVRMAAAELDATNLLNLGGSDEDCGRGTKV